MPTIIENLKDMVSEVTEGAAEAGDNMTKQTVELVKKPSAKPTPQPLVATPKQK